METLLITGANGLLGRHLTPLLARERKVVALGRPARGEDPANVERIAANLSSPIDPAILPDRIDAVVYLAQSDRFRDFPGGAADMFEVNVARPLQLIEQARAAGAKRFVYASTGSIYAPGPAPIAESDATPAPGFYAASKLSAEQLLWRYAGEIDVILLRFFFIYGRGQKRDMLLPRLVDNVAAGRTVTLQGEDGIRINPIHVDDAALAVAGALRAEGSLVANIAGPETLSIRDLCETAGRALGVAPVFEAAPAGAGDLIADIGVMRDRLHAPTRHFEDGVRDLLPG